MRKHTPITLLFFATFVFGQQKIDKKKLSEIRVKSELRQRSIQPNQVEKYVLELNEKAAFYGFINGAPAVIEDADADQARSTNSDQLQNNTLPGISVNGSGAKVYIWDGNMVRPRNSHQEFGTRLTNNQSTFAAGAHATAVSSVVGAAGFDATQGAQGMAPAVLMEHYDFNSDIAEITNEVAQPDNANYMISNHSYNFRAGWFEVTSGANPGWFWYGYPHLDANESALHGYYGAVDEDFDAMVYAAPQLTVIRAVGNDLNEGPAPGTSHFFLDASNNWVASTDTRPVNCGQTGFDCLPYASVGKNAISVGAVLPLATTNNRYTSPGDVVLTDFSSKGPTDDGRIKPDLVAVGQGVSVASATGDANYVATAMGTSFSTPSVTGIAALLQEVSAQEMGRNLNAAEMKALLLHTANEAGNIGPDYTFGWGLVNAFAAAEQIVKTVGDDAYFDSQNLADGATINMDFVAKGGEPLVITVAWTDPAATASPAVVFNDRTPRLVNDLDVRVVEGGSTYFPWRLDVNAPATAATKADNSVDNVEQIVIDSPTAGATYTVAVNHKGSLTNGSQDFAMAVKGVSENSLNLWPAEPLIANLNLYPTVVRDVVGVYGLEISASVEVYNSAGQLVVTSQVNEENDFKVNVRSLNAGVYLMRIQNSDTKRTLRFVKK